MRRKFLVLICLYSLMTLLGCSTQKVNRSNESSDLDDIVWYRDFVKSSSGKVEVLISYRKKIQLPVILIIHGHQSDDDRRPFMRSSMGALWFSPKRLKDQTEKGYAVVSMSMPGYGASFGEPDFCGPLSKESVHSVIDWIKNQPWADKNKISLYGVSRGAILGAQVAAEDPTLAAVVLVSGSYNLEEDFQDSSLTGIKKNMENEIKPSVNSKTLRERSAIWNAEKIKIPILILHGADDEKGKFATAKKFADEISKNNKNVFLKKFDGKGHLLDKFEDQKEVHDFLFQYLKSTSPNFKLN